MTNKLSMQCGLALMAAALAVSLASADGQSSGSPGDQAARAGSVDLAQVDTDLKESSDETQESSQPLEIAHPDDADGAVAPRDAEPTDKRSGHGHEMSNSEMISLAFVFMLATFIGIGVIRRVSRLLHTPLMSLTNAISAISVVGAIVVAGGEDYSTSIRILGAIALFASMTNIISGFLITDRMLRMFKTRDGAN